MATRIIFKVEQITEEAMQVQFVAAAEGDRGRVGFIACSVQADGDPRTQDYLTLLRSLRDEFTELSSQPGVLGRSRQLSERVGQFFRSLRRSIARVAATARVGQPANGSDD